MKYMEYGRENQETMIFLHGGGLSWWNYREEAEELQDRYHIIIPILDGHSGSDQQFTSIEENAEHIISYIDKSLSGKVLLMGGVSLGAQVLLEILSRRKEICKYALVESAMVIPSSFTHAMIRPAFGASYGLIRHRGFSKLQFKSSFLRANTGYSLKESIKKCSADVHVYFGQKETPGIKKSARKITEMILVQRKLSL